MTDKPKTTDQAISVDVPVKSAFAGYAGNIGAGQLPPLQPGNVAAPSAAAAMGLLSAPQHKK